MKPSHRSIFFRTNRLFVAATLGLLAPLAQAATFTWTNTAGGSWAEQTNWSGGTLPTTTDDTADFSTLDITAGTTVTLDADQEINKLLFADATTASNDWTVAAGTPSTSTLTLGGTTPEISVTNRTAIISAKLAGSDNWTKTGAGTLRLTNTTNSFTGDITVQTGVLEEWRGSLGTTDGATYINSTGLTTTGGQLLMNAFGVLYSTSENVVIQGTGSPANGSGTAALRFGGSAGSDTTFCNMDGLITLDGNANYKIDVYLQPSHWKINGGIARSGVNTGTLFLDLSHFNQTTPVRLTINSTIDNNGGPVTLLGNTAGILQMDTADHDLGAFTINGTYEPTYQTILKLGIDDALTTNQNMTLTRGTFDLAGYNQTVNALSGAATNSLITNTDAGPSTLTIGNGGGGATFSGLVAAGGAGAISLVKVGAGTATLNSTSTDPTNTGFVGGITVNEGTLHLNANRQLSPVTATIASGATLELSLNNQTTNMTFNGEGTLKTSLSIIQAGGAVATFALGANALIDVSGTLWAHNSNVWTSNLSDMTVAGTFNTAFANVRVDALTGPGSGTINLSNGVSDFGLTVGVNDGSGQFDGTIAAANGGGTLRKVGNGTQTLAGPVGYIGDTDVSGGTLVLKQINTANESSTVTIASGAVLGLDFVGTDTVDKLFFGATQQPMGTYSASSVPAGATITTASFSFGGSLEVTTGAAPISGFATWITGTFAGGATVPGGQQGPNDDPDGDGISNLVEYAIAGQDPTVPSGAVGTLTGKTLSFSKRLPLASDITYAVEESTDLGIADVWEVVTPTVNDGTTISYTLPDGPARNFARLKITQP